MTSPGIKGRALLKGQVLLHSPCRPLSSIRMAKAMHHGTDYCGIHGEVSLGRGALLGKLPSLRPIHILLDPTVESAQ